MPRIRHSVPAPGCFCLGINEPERRNALGDDLVRELTDAVCALELDDSCRVILLTGEGTSFCAGLDLDETLALGAKEGEENQANAVRFANLLFAIYSSRKPTIALVNGPAFGAGAGLVAACDIAVASDVARFRFPEVRVGLIPAVVSPYVLAAIGSRTARRYFLTAETFDATTALRMGLVHDVLPASDLLARGLAFAQEIQRGGPRSLAACKQLVGDVLNLPVDAMLVQRTATAVAVQRTSAEAHQGIAAALAKRDPPWGKDPHRARGSGHT